MNRDDPLTRTLIMLGIGVAVSLVVALAPDLDPSFVPLKDFPVDSGAMLRVKIFVSTLSLVLLAFLLRTYAVLYRELPNRFTLSLVVFCVSLLLYAAASNPLVHLALGLGGGRGLGQVTFLPDLFATVAVVMLLYQSQA